MRLQHHFINLETASMKRILTIALMALMFPGTGWCQSPDNGWTACAPADNADAHRLALARAEELMINDSGHARIAGAESSSAATGRGGEYHSTIVEVKQNSIPPGCLRMNEAISTDVRGGRQLCVTIH